MKKVLTLVALLCAVSSISVSQVTSETILKRLGFPTSAKLLIIHADDFGVAHSVDRAISEALEKGWVTSASIMVPCPWFPEVAEFARTHPDADLGVHLVLTSEWVPYRWGPVGHKPAPSLIDAQGYFPLTETEAAKQDNPADVEYELRSQIDKAKEAGVNFTHLDSHMGTLFQNQSLFTLYQRLGEEYKVPNFIAGGSDVHGERNFKTEADRLVITQDLQMTPGVPPDQWVNAYKKMLSGLKPGVYQLIVHPGYDDPELEAITEGHPDWGAKWRELDLNAVSSPEFRQFLKDEGFTLVTWRELSKAMIGPQ